MSNLYLIGTVHTDFNGPKKLRTLYDRLKPDIILGEANQEDIARTNELLDGLELKLKDYDSCNSLGEFIQLLRDNSCGFELQTNLDYASEKGIPFYYAGSRTPQVILDWWEETSEELVKSCRKKKKLDFKKIAEAIKKYHKNQNSLARDARRWDGSILAEGFLLSKKYFGMVGEPDKCMENTLREIYTPDKVIAFTAGMLHCLDSLFSLTLYSRIRDLKPQRIPLL